MVVPPCPASRAAFGAPVPGVMILMGRWNWWLPRWIDRFLPHLSVEGTDFFAARDASAAKTATETAGGNAPS